MEHDEKLQGVGGGGAAVVVDDNRSPFRSIEIIMCRHGESDGNAAGVCQGFTEGTLTIKGKHQADTLGLALFKEGNAFPSSSRSATGTTKTTCTTRNFHFEHIYCSDLNRVRQTCEIALKHAYPPTKRVEVQFLDLLR